MRIEQPYSANGVAQERLGAEAGARVVLAGPLGLSALLEEAEGGGAAKHRRGVQRGALCRLAEISREPATPLTSIQGLGFRV
jgi:hypothetical protein